MNIVNLSAEPLNKIHSWLPAGLRAEQVVFLPDACPGKSPLPTGSVVRTGQEDWRRYAVSDVGCGMRLLRAAVPAGELTRARWNALAELLRQNRGGLGDLGGGNHFLDALEPYDSDQLHFLIHTGSRLESGLVDHYIEQPNRFDDEFARVTGWACANREAVQGAAEKIFGRMEVLLDAAHNSVEQQPDGTVVIRKGAVKLESGQIAVIPSHMEGDVALVEAGTRSAELLHSMSHGTGRKLPRGEAKELGACYDYQRLRERVLIPDSVDNASLRTEISPAYRALDDCLALIDGFVTVVRRFSVIGYIGHL